ncbi:MAG: hypothetical protein ABL966_11920 [Acidimicrobiales bacterium]
MPSALRAQVALIGLLAVMLIPIGTSSLRGLTHILTCQERSATPFSVEVPDTGPPVISASSVIERDPSGAPADRSLCGGLTLDLRIGSTTEARADVTVEISNQSDFGWRGSVQLRLDGTVIPIDIGEIGAGDTASDRFELRLDAGETYAVDGTLLIGP